jgi:beta-glucosidase
MVYNHKPTTYRHKYHSEKKTPLYVFGHGLCYTSYAYNNLKVIGNLQSANDELTISVDVTNTGKMAGEEIAQLYLRDEKSQVTRPVMELKGYQRIALNPSETKTIQFKLKPHHLAYYSMEYDWIMEAGNFQIMVGGNSDLSSLKKTNYTAEQTIKL